MTKTGGPKPEASPPAQLELQRALVTEVTYTRDPARRKQLDRLIERTLAGEFTVKPEPAAAD